MSRSTKEFEELTTDVGLIKLSLTGRKVTWRRGASYSKLDYVLVELQWIQSCVYLKLSCLNCSILNRILLLLDTEEVNWGPKSFQNLDAWFSHPGFLKANKGGMEKLW